jgi:hypothetical protein
VHPWVAAALADHHGDRLFAGRLGELSVTAFLGELAAALFGEQSDEARRIRGKIRTRADSAARGRQALSSLV